MIKIRNIETPHELSKYVRKIALFESKNKISYKQKLTPSAFTYLSFNSEDIPLSVFGNKKVQPKEKLQIAGPKTNENIFVEYNGQLFQILVEFTAAGFYYLFHTSPTTIVNSLSNLDNFVPTKIKQQLEMDLIESDRFENQITYIHDFLLERRESAKPFIDYIEKALQIIEKKHGHINLNSLSDELSIGKRQFDRTFQKVVGVTPKTYCKIIQLHYVISLIQAKQFYSVQDLSYQANFYDQAHFTNRFKELTGFTPSEFIKSDKHIALKYFTDLS